MKFKFSRPDEKVETARITKRNRIQNTAANRFFDHQVRHVGDLLSSLFAHMILKLNLSRHDRQMKNPIYIIQMRWKRLQATNSSIPLYQTALLLLKWIFYLWKSSMKIVWIIAPFMLSVTRVHRKYISFLSAIYIYSFISLYQHREFCLSVSITKNIFLTIQSVCLSVRLSPNFC